MIITVTRKQAELAFHPTKQERSVRLTGKFTRYQGPGTEKPKKSRSQYPQALEHIGQGFALEQGVASVVFPSHLLERQVHHRMLVGARDHHTTIDISKHQIARIYADAATPPAPESSNLSEPPHSASPADQGHRQTATKSCPAPFSH